MSFDQENYSQTQYHNFNAYGVINGNSTVVVIKTEYADSFYGEQNKYLRMAENIHQKYGATVFCFANNWGIEKKPLKDDLIYEVESYMKTYLRIEDYKIYFVGYESGGLIGLLYGQDYSVIKRMLLISPEIKGFGNIKSFWKEVEKKLENNKNQQIIFAYGELDEQREEVLSLLKTIKNKRIKGIVVPKVNQLFEGALDEFIDLPINYLLKNPYSEQELAEMIMDEDACLLERLSQ